jgi:DNA gyrase subunit A
MRLGSLTGLEREKLEAEWNELVATIRDLEDILARAERVTAIIREDLTELMEKYGDARRTQISTEEVDGGFDVEELITEDLTVVTFSRDGYVKRVPLDTYRTQARGGRGIKGSESKEGDVLKSLFVTSTHDYLLFFSNRGQVFWKKAYQMPESGRTSKGRAMANLVELRDGEEIRTILRVPEFTPEQYLVFATRNGVIKKSPLEAYSRPKKNGIRAILVDDDDEVVGVSILGPGETVMVASNTGRAVRFDEGAARTMGRTSRGVRGIRLQEGEHVVGLLVTKQTETDGFVLTASVRGYGKRTPIDDYPIKGRGGKGVINIKVSERNGEVVAVRYCHERDDLMFITERGMIVRTRVADVSTVGRNTQGVRLVNLKDGDRLVSVEVVSGDDLETFAKEIAAEPRPAQALDAESELLDDEDDDEVVDEAPEASAEDDDEPDDESEDE